MIGLSACTAYTPPVQHKRGGLLTVGIDSFPVSLNPLVAGDVSSVRAYTPLFPQLFGLDRHMQPVPDLASGPAETTDGGKSWTVHLRHGANWSDGKPIDSADVVYTVETERSPALDTRARFDWGELAGVTATDSTTVRFELTAADAAFPANHLAFAVVPRHVLASTAPERMSRGSFSTQPAVSGGPFKYKSQTEGRDLLYELNPAYYGRRPSVDRVAMTVVTDPMSAPNALSQGFVLWFPGLTRRAADAARQVSAIKVPSYPASGYAALTFNSRPGRVFADLAPRRAVAGAIDRTRLAKMATQDHGVPMWGEINPDSWAYDPAAATPLPADLGSSRAGLEAAGWTRGAGGMYEKAGATLSAALIYPDDDPDRRRAARQVVSDLMGAGIELAATELAPGAFAARLASGDFEVALTDNGQAPDPDPGTYVRSVAADAAHPVNYGGFSDPRLDSLLDADRAAAVSSASETRAKRRGILTQAEARIREQVPLVPLWSALDYQGLNETVQFGEPVGNHLDQDRNGAIYARVFLSA